MIDENCWDYDWPRVESTSDCFGYQYCRNWRLALGNVIGADEVQRAWERTKSRLLKFLKE